MKRSFDLIFSLLGLIVLAPVFAAVAVAIKIESAGPVFYRGVRAGRYGKAFRIFKFRTMVMNAEALGSASTPEDDQRITQVGRFLRKLKLDELPQLLNVLRGEMSLVGPRPQVPWAVNLYSDGERALLAVRPGMTDYASILFRDEGALLKGADDTDRTYLERIAPEEMRLGLED